MQIIIPMSGVGQRFIDAGYKDPKPLIEIDGKPIIEHVLNLFPGETNFKFICNSKHLEETQMRSILERIAPQGEIIEIEPHKFGPVYAVSKIFEKINDDEEVIVNYCDFSTYWDYKDFLNHTRSRNAHGAIPAYKNFHPHMMGSTNYAFMRDDQQWMQEIKEKEPFTDNRMQEYASNGTYYFKSGSIVKKYFKQLIDQDINLKGEYYVSLIYNLLIQDQLKVSIYKIQHMLQWGTPQDVEEYNGWSKYFSDIIKNKTSDTSSNINIVLPMAGKGSRFTNEGYETPKPLLEVSGKHMVTQAIDSLPKADQHIFICQKEHLENSQLKESLNNDFNNSEIVSIDYITEGQACTAKLGIDQISNNQPIIIGACDNGMIWSNKEFKKVLSEDPDIIVWSFQNYSGANQKPEMYGWTSSKNGAIQKVSVKKAISDNPKYDHGIVGSFYFKNKEIYNQCFEYLKDNNIRINNEFYIDSMVEAGIKLNLKVKSFVIDHYLCWGTPNDYETFNYWQSFFHKCDWHPYSITLDPTVNQEKSDKLINQFKNFHQEYK